MAARKITINSVKVLKLGETIWDTEIKGFGCRRQKGEDRVFVLKYRDGKGRTARQYLYTVGKLGSPWTPETAREAARKILGQVANGENPASERKQEKRANSINEAFEQFLESSKGKRSARTQKEYRRMYETMAKSAIGKHRAQDVIRADITRLHNSLSSTPVVANRLLQALSAFFNWCEVQEYRSEGSNPCRHLNKYREKSRERFLSEDELFYLSEALATYEKEHSALREQPHKKNKTGETADNPTTSYVVAAIRLLIFTGARCGEILNLKWSDVDFDKKILRLQESKTGQKTIYLSAPALQVLSEIPRIEGNQFVICGKKEGSRLVNIKDPWIRIREIATLNIWKQNEKLTALIRNVEAALPTNHTSHALFEAAKETATKEKIDLPAGLTDVHLHDLRHNFASTAVTSGLHLKVIGSLLGHSKTTTTERYAHLANDPLQMATEAISKRILNAMSRPPDPGNIVTMGKRG